MTDIREIPFARPWIEDEDREAVMRVLHGHVLTHGPECKAFEKEFGAFMGPEANCVSVSSCMAALHLSYLHLGLGPGDEVIVPAQTHTATVHAVEWVGAKPVFVDCDPVTGNMTAELIKPAITARTKAISVVHYIGIPCDMPAIMAVADAHNLKVIEDCAIAIGSRWEGKHVGLFGDIGCFSFYPVKHITTAEGGMFVSKHKEIATAVATLRAFGVDRPHPDERKIPGIYDVLSLGLNYRMSEVQAALGRTQVAKIPKILARRKANFEALKAVVDKIPGVHIADTNTASAVNSHYCAVAVIDKKLDRNAIVLKLNARGVGTSVYYPAPVNRMTYYRNKYGYEAAKFPNAEQFSDHAVALPCGPHLNTDDMAYVGNALAAVIKESL